MFKYMPSKNSYITLYTHRNPYSTPGTNTIMVGSAYAHTHAYTHTHTRTHTHTHARPHARTHTYTHMHTQTDTQHLAGTED